MPGLGVPTIAGGGPSAPGLSTPSFGLGVPGSGGGGYTIGQKALGFLGSALESFPEMFGIEPSQQAQAFRAANPVTGLVSELVGQAPFYVGGAKLIQVVPRLNAIVQNAPKFFGTAERPIAAVATKWATEAALLEGARVGIAATPLPSLITGKEREASLGELAGQGGINIAAGGALGGIVGGIAGRAARGPAIWQLVPEAHPAQPLVQRIRGLDAAIERGGLAAPDGTVKMPWTEEQLVDLKHQRRQLINANYADIEPAYTPTGHVRLEPELGGRYNYKDGLRIVRPLENDPAVSAGKTYQEALNSWMNPNKVNVGRQGEARLLTVDSEKGFASQGELDAFLGKLGLGDATEVKDNLAMLGQNHRVLRVNAGTGDVKAAANAAKELDNLLTGRRPGTIRGGNPVSLGPDGWWMMREAEEGMWVVAKKVEGTVAKPKAGDEWFVMRTDNPDILDPQAVKFREETINKSAYWPERVQANIGSERFDLANTFERELGAMQFIPKGIRPTVSNMAAAGKGVAQDILNYLQPLVGIASRNNRANYIANLMKTLTDHEEAVVSQTLHGARVLDADKSPVAQFITLKEPTVGGLADFYKTLDDADWADVQSMLELQVPFERMEELARGGFVTPKAYQTLTGLETISRANVEEFARLKEVIGAPSAKSLIEDFSARAGHYGLTRVRDGGFYAFLDDARTGELAGIVAGNTAKEARDKAYKVITQQAKSGKELNFAGMQDELLKDEGRLQKFKAAVRKPGFLKERGNLVGDELMNQPLNAKRFTEMVDRNLRARERFKTNVVLQEKTWYPMMRLANEDASVHAQLEKRLAILQGDEGKFAEFQNRAIDKVLGPILGKDSASAIVRTTQKTLNAFQFGFANLAHYTLNAVTMFQTTFPEAAFLLRTAGTDLSNYITVPIRDGNGRIVDAAHALSDVKLFHNSLKRALTKSDDPRWQSLLNEMTAQGIIAPKYAEAHVGATGSIVKDLKGAFEDGGSFVRWAGAVNEIALAKSEEFSRLVGVATAYELGKTLGFADDAFRLGRFTREFLSKTSYNYTTVDRPTIFTTPVGSLLGTFKTWMFHYMVSMAKYAGGGRQTLAPLLWQTAATAAIGGGIALPLLKPIADGASRWLTDHTFMENLYAAVGPDNERWADGVMYGIPGTLGLSLAAQASSPGSDPMRDASMIFNAAVFDRMGQLGKAVGAGWEAHKATGTSPFADDKTRDLMVRALAPRTMYRAMSAMEDRSIRSLNSGYRVLDNVSMGDALLYSMGFNPVDLDKSYTAYAEIRKHQETMRAAVGELGRQLADAWEDGDNTAASRVFVSAMAKGLDTGSVLRSAKSRMERGETTQLQFAVGKDKTGDTEGWGFITGER